MSRPIRRQFSWELEERTPSPAAPEPALNGAAGPDNKVSVVGYNAVSGPSQPIDSNFRYDPTSPPVPTKSLLSQNSNLNSLSPPTKGHPLVQQNPRFAQLHPQNIPISPEVAATGAGAQPLTATRSKVQGVTSPINKAAMSYSSRPPYAGNNNYSAGADEWDANTAAEGSTGPYTNQPANLNAAGPLRPHDSYTEHLQYYVNPNDRPEGRALTPQPNTPNRSQMDPLILPGASASSVSLGAHSDFDHPPPTPAHIYNHANNSSQRVIGDGSSQYSGNSPYNRHSAGWDPALASRLGVDGSVDFVDDDDYVAPGTAGAIGMTSNPSRTQLDGASNGFAADGVMSPGVKDASYQNLMLGEKENRRKMREKEAAARKRRLKWIIIIIGLITLAAAAGGITGGILNQLKKDEISNRKNGKEIAEDDDKSGLLKKGSAEIVELMDNPKLHKVFHGIDYTPLNTAVYPDCEKFPASQNNVTRDIAVLSLLTDKIRLYGNDCNQTELVMTAIERLEVNMTVWVGVWIDDNEETNDRQIKELWNILDKHDPKLIEGIAVGNEVLFRKEKTISELIEIIDGVRDGLKERGIKGIPIGSSDLGSAWDADLASSVDVLMANIHPFFGQASAEEAADWTIEFFNTWNVPKANAAPNKPRAMISEVGWPSGGGTHGGKGGKAVAGIKQLNGMLDDFICKQNKAGLEYFWFSAFDEPWKVRFNKPDEGDNSEEWEDKWGLMDVNRVLKPGITIPDCK